MTHLYRIEGTVAVTFYVKANSDTEAYAKAHRYVNNEPPVTSNVTFDSKYLPEISISPAMTVMSIEGEAEEVL